MPHIRTGDQNPKAQKIRMRQPCEVGGEQHLRKRDWHVQESRGRKEMGLWQELRMGQHGGSK